jgi:hypothetical protein
MLRRSWSTLLIAALLGIVTPDEAGAWGATGHRLVSAIGVAHLPSEVPAFVRSAEARAMVRELGAELDRSKGAGRTHDAERDPGHHVILNGQASVMGIVSLDALPVTREEYDTALRAHGKTQYVAGYLPYSIVDGWQQLRKDFALWRAAVVGGASAVDAADRAWFEADRKLRETLILRDIGVWSHYIGDASQPLHVSMHSNGWYGPNPKGYSTSRGIHADFEGEFVKRFVPADRVTAAVRPYQDCACPIEERTRRYLRATHSMVERLYELEATGAFKGADAAGVDFAAQRLAAGASELRDMIVDAWRASADATVGYPPVSVRDIESKALVPTKTMFVGD